MKPRIQVIRSIFKRNFASYFSGILGYLFIVVFVVLGGWLAFTPEFFTGNEPNLDQLTNYYPVLLLFFIPAVTMTVWADEKKSGTDELLFTLPAQETEILLGKYLAVLAVYTVALLFSMAHVFVLTNLGNPDMGLIGTTYFGYWIAGAALLSAGMFASILTSNVTVAFVLGMVFCAIPVFIDKVARFVQLGDLFANVGLDEQFRDFGMGVVPLSSLFYFGCFTVLMLYLNHTLMTRRHWQSHQGGAMAWQHVGRVVSLAAILFCLMTWIGYSSKSADLTRERLFSLSPATKSVLSELDSERPIEIQAFMSSEVPKEYIETRKRLEGLLRQFDKLGGKDIAVRYVDVEPFSEQAEEASHFGIDAVEMATDVDGRQTQIDFYLGAVIISSYDKVVVPFFGKGLPIEYELTRSIQTVAQEDRHTVGILTTDAGLVGGREWQIVRELKQQYEVEEISADMPIDAEKFDVLLAAMPSSLTDPQMDNLVAYAKTGSPLLVFDDPFPMSLGSNGMGVSGAPRQSKPSQGGGFMGQGAPPPEQKADGGRATRLLEALGIDWQYDACLFDMNNPHSEFGMLPAEYVFITNSEDEENAFNVEDETTQGLQELIALYPGKVSKRSGAGVDFIPLLNTSVQSGVLDWAEFVDEGGFNIFSMSPTVNPRRNPFRTLDRDQHALAARVTADSDGNKVNAIYVADIDMISDFFFEERNRGFLSVEFDNVTFVLNAVDSLVGDDQFIALRSRRPAHRTLTRMEELKQKSMESANEAEQQADKDAEKELEERRDQLAKRVKEIAENEDLDPIAKTQLRNQAEQAEQQRMSLAEAQIEQKKQEKIRKIRADKNREDRRLENRARLLSVILPPIPALALGVFVFVWRLRDEKSNVVESRRRKH